MALLLALLLSGPADAAAADLADFAAWCRTHQLRAFRIRACEGILLFRPDDKEAREALGYEWDGEGLRWVRPKPKTPPADEEGPRLDEARERWRVLTEKYADAVLDDEGPGAEARARRLAIALRLAPDHARAREANGEVRRGDGWELAETARARERAREIDALRGKVLAAVAAPAEGPVTKEDAKFGLDFRTAYVGTSWRALGTVPAEECKELLRLCDATFPFLDGVFELGANAPGGLSLYVIPGNEEKALGRHPAYTPADREFALDLHGSWVPGAFSFVAWSERPPWRRDVVVRSAFGLHLNHRFGLDPKQGWAWEGFGAYLTYQLAGTRFAVTARRGPYAQDAAARVKQERGVEFQKTDWCALAARRLEGEKAPELRVLTGKDVNTLTAEEALVSYAMAEYLATGFPKRSAAFLKAYGSGIALDDAMASHLGFDFTGFERRFRRWLKER